MYVGKTLFAQVMEFVPWTSFTRMVKKIRNRGKPSVFGAEIPQNFRRIGMKFPISGVTFSKMR